MAYLDNETAKRLLKSLLKEKRYTHSLSVADYSRALAPCHGIDPEQAYRAGLLHDMMHCQPDDEMLALARQHKVDIPPHEAAHPFLLHGPVAAAVLRDDWQETDEALLEAIHFHTIADPAMGKLAKLIYLTDMLEPTRPVWEGQESLRTLLKQDLDAAMVKAMEHTVVYLREQGKEPHPDTERILSGFRKILEANHQGGIA